MNKGTIDFFDKEKGYGNIISGWNKKIFVHISQIHFKDKSNQDILIGDEVEFDLVETNNGLLAINVELVNKNEEKRGIVYIGFSFKKNVLKIDFRKIGFSLFEINKIKEELRILKIKYRPKIIIFNFEKVDEIKYDIEGDVIRFILGRYNEYRLDNIRLVLVGVKSRVKKLFIISGINQLMDIYETVNIGG